jgi:hypothetical protein
MTFTDPTTSPRWQQMVGRVRLTLGRLGSSPSDVEQVLSGLHAAGVHRGPHFDDEEAPAWLHPGRTLLILRVDAEITEPEVLHWGAQVDQAFAPWTRPEAEAFLGGVEFPTLHGGLFASHPAHVWEAWQTEAALLDPPWGRVLLADALDHLRHLHLHPDPELRRQGAAVARDYLAPLAERAGGTLHRRIQWWVRRVAPGLR